MTAFIKVSNYLNSVINRSGSKEIHLKHHQVIQIVINKRSKKRKRISKNNFNPFEKNAVVANKDMNKKAKSIWRA